MANISKSSAAGPGLNAIAAIGGLLNPTNWLNAVDNIPDTAPPAPWQAPAPWNPTLGGAYTGYNPGQDVGSLMRNALGSTGGGMAIGGESALMPLRPTPQVAGGNNMANIEQELKALNETLGTNQGGI